MAIGLTSQPPKARYTRQERQAFKSGAMPDPRAPKMSQPVQAPQNMQRVSPGMYQNEQGQVTRTPNGMAPQGARPPMPQQPMQQFGNGQQQYKPFLPDPGFNGNYQMGAGFPGGSPMQGFNPKFRGY